MTDFRARGTIMGLAGLTAVFGMGTGGTPPVSSPEIHPRGGQALRVQSGWSVTGCETFVSVWRWLATFPALGGSRYGGPFAVVSSDRFEN